MHELIVDLGVVIVLATTIGILFHRFRQPALLGYLLAGAVAGPQIGFGLITNAENIEVIGELGLVLLLFVIGLEIDARHFLKLGKGILVVGGGQIAIGVLLGLAAFAWLPSLSRLEAIYFAGVCAMSSTAVVVKLLYDRFETDTAAGRLTIGVLVLQDVFAILALAVQPHLAAPKIQPLAIAVGATVLLVGVAWLAGTKLLPSIFAWVAKSPELVAALALAWCAFVAGVAHKLHLSLEMGALIAGLIVATMPYHLHVAAKMLPLRDFFLTLYFVSVGMKIAAPTTATLALLPVAIAVVIATRFASVLPLAIATGQGARTGFVASLNLSQLSEFALVVASLGIGSGHVGGSVLSVLVYTMAITAILSSYGIGNGHRLYSWLSQRFGRKATAAIPRDDGSDDDGGIVILGFHRTARALIDELTIGSAPLLKRIRVIDFNPDVLADLERRGIKTTFGDIGHLDILRGAGIEKASVIVSTIPDMLLKGTSNVALVERCRQLSREAAIVATAETAEQSTALEQAGATEVLLPYSLAGREFALLLKALARAETSTQKLTASLVRDDLDFLDSTRA